MYPVSEAFKAALRAGAPVVTTIDVCRGGRITRPNIGWAKPSSVTVDDSATSWRSGSITVVDVDHDLIPKTPADALAPYGNDLAIRSGYRLPDGSIEQVPVALLRIVVAEPTARGIISISGAYDYSRVVARARFETIKVFPKGYSRPKAIRDMILERVPFCEFDFLDDGSTLPLTIFEEGERYGSPWKACMALAEAEGQRVLFAPNGPVPRAILRPIPEATTTPVWEFKPGSSSTLIDMRPRQDASEAYNVYVVTGESADLAASGVGPVRGSAEITDLSSPINPATFGRAPIFLTSSFMRTDAQCVAVARANLPLKAGGTEGLTIVGFPNPAHEAGDVVLAQKDELGILGNQVISRFTLDLGMREPTPYTCHARRVT